MVFSHVGIIALSELFDNENPAGMKNFHIAGMFCVEFLGCLIDAWKFFRVVINHDDSIFFQELPRKFSIFSGTCEGVTTVNVDDVVVVLLECLQNFLRVANMCVNTVFVSRRTDIVKVSLFEVFGVLIYFFGFESTVA